MLKFNLMERVSNCWDDANPFPGITSAARGEDGAEKAESKVERDVGKPRNHKDTGKRMKPTLVIYRRYDPGRRRWWKWY